MPWFKKADDANDNASIFLSTDPTSIYSKESEELGKLIRILIFKGVPREEIDSYTQTMPMNTKGDIEEIKMKLWNLGAEVYGIPRQVLITEMESKKKPRMKL